MKSGKQTMVQQQAAPIPNAHLVATSYQGSVPPPEMLKKFNEVNPSYSDDIMNMAKAASERQTALVENQRMQIQNDLVIREKEIETTKNLREREIRSRDRNMLFANIITLIGLLAGIGLCAFLMYLSYMLLKADKSGYALATASPVIGVALVAAIKLLKK